MNNETEMLLEQVSALVDGELEADQLSRVIDRLSRDVALRKYWSDCYRNGGLMRGEQVRCSVDFSERVFAAVAKESDLVRSGPAAQIYTIKQPEKSWLKAATGFALAASVAVVTVFTANWLTLEQDRGLAPVADSGVQPTEIAAKAEAVIDPEDDAKQPDHQLVSDEKDFAIGSAPKGARLVDYEQLP